MKTLLITLLKTVLIFVVTTTTFFFEMLITSDIPMNVASDDIIILSILHLFLFLVIFTFAKQKHILNISIGILLVFFSLGIVKLANVAYLTIEKTYVPVIIELVSLSLSLILCISRRIKLSKKMS